MAQGALNGGSREGFPRHSGILLHLTSLPGRYGLGDLSVVVGVQEGARAGIRSPGGELDCLRSRQSNAVVLM